MYRVKRKLQEQSGAYLICLPKLWIDGLGLQQGDSLEILFNSGYVRIIPPPEKARVKSEGFG